MDPPRPRVWIILICIFIPVWGRSASQIPASISDSQTRAPPNPILVSPRLLLGPNRPIVMTTVKVSEGERLVLNCSAPTLAPFTRVQWLKAKRKKYFQLLPLPPEKSSPPRLRLLTLENVTLDDAGWYICAVPRSNNSLLAWKGRSLRIYRSFHVRITRVTPNPIVNSTRMEAAAFQGLSSIFSIGSDIMSLISIFAFGLSLFGCLCCGGGRACLGFC